MSAPNSLLDAHAHRPDREMLGSYALVTDLALGALTKIHAAEALLPDDSRPPLVVKRLRDRQPADSHDRDLLLAAGAVGLDVRSPNLVRTFEVHEGPEPFLVMERLEGATFSSLLAAGAHRDLTRYLVPVLIDVLNGLHALHTLYKKSGEPAALVHGAPCARHIVVGSDGIGRLVDWTHAVGHGMPWSARRDERLQPSEMAPEQALSPTHVDPRCDVFIVGTLLWQALTGRPLFGGESRSAVLESMLRQPILAPSEVGGRFGRGMDEICRRALQRSRRERISSAAEMAQALRDEAEYANLDATREEIGALARSLAQPGVPAASPVREAAGRKLLSHASGARPLPSVSTIPSVVVTSRPAPSAAGLSTATLLGGFHALPEDVLSSAPTVEAPTRRQPSAAARAESDWIVATPLPLPARPALALGSGSGPLPARRASELSRNLRQALRQRAKAFATGTWGVDDYPKPLFKKKRRRVGAGMGRWLLGTTKRLLLALLVGGAVWMAPEVSRLPIGKRPKPVRRPTMVEQAPPPESATAALEAPSAQNAPAAREIPVAPEAEAPVAPEAPDAPVALQAAEGIAAKASGDAPPQQPSEAAAAEPPAEPSARAAAPERASEPRKRAKKRRARGQAQAERAWPWPETVAPGAGAPSRPKRNENEQVPVNPY